MMTPVSIIVPTYHESPNIEALARRVFAALDAARMTGEIIFVDDDSRDGTAEIVRRLASEYSVRLLVRTEERGLASAVVCGLERARHDIMVIMDADLQHPPESVPALVEGIVRGAEMAIGSRYVPGAGIDAEWSWFRRLNSFVATVPARMLVGVRDPMSGFCAMSRETFHRAGRLHPIGYKIVLELAVKSRCDRIAEVPITFAGRAAGASKLSLREQWRYARHLARLYWFRFSVPIAVLAATGAVLIAWAGRTFVRGDAP